MNDEYEAREMSERSEMAIDDLTYRAEKAESALKECRALLQHSRFLYAKSRDESVKVFEEWRRNVESALTNLEQQFGKEFFE